MPAKTPPLTHRTAKELRELGRQIRSHRERQKLSATITAEAAGLSRVTLYRIERGEPSVTIGAYFSVILALGLHVAVRDQNTSRAAMRPSAKKLPEKIRVADYDQLKRLAWQLKRSQKIDPKEALEIYERNWRHIDLQRIDKKERDFIEALLAKFGRERLLV